MLRFSSIRSLRRKPHGVVLQQKREIIVLLGPLIAGGIALLVFGTVGKYVVRALKRMEEKDDMESVDVGANSGHIKHEAIASCFGIDIGSTYSRISFMHENSVGILENKEGMRATSCVVYSNDMDTSVGRIASSKKWTNPPQVGYGYHMTVGLPDTDKIVTEIVNSLPSDLPHQPTGEEYSREVSGQKITASALWTIFSRDLRGTSSSKVLISGVPAVISTPNFFSSMQKMAAINSTRDGDFNCVAAVSDAVGAILGSHRQGIVGTLQGKFLVMDIGGHITQISVVDCDFDTSDGSPVLLAEQTLFDVGGEYVSDVMARHVATVFAKQTGGIDILKDKLATQRLYDAVEAAKIDLSKSPSTTISIPYITADATGPKHLEMTLSRSTLESMVGPMVGRIAEPLREVLTAAGVASPSRDLTGFLTVGGGARMPIFRRVAEESVGMPPTVPQEPEDVVALGAALYSTYCPSAVSR